MEECYQSQEALILRRAKERNVDTQQLQQFFESKIKEISANYPDPTYSYLWRLSKVEFLVWERFFPTDPFPGMLEYVSARSVSGLPAKPKDPINMAWTHDRYNPAAQPSSTKDAVLLRASESRYSEARRTFGRNEAPRRIRQTGDHYSPPPLQSSKLVDLLNVAVKDEDKVAANPAAIAPQGPNTHQKLTQGGTATYDAQYPGSLMYREQVLNAGESSGNRVYHKAHQEFIQPGGVSYDAVKRNSSGYSATPAFRFESTKLNPPPILGRSYHIHSNSTGSSNGRELGKERARIRQEHEEPGEAYQNQESVMERRAIQRNFRGEFFSYLQKARDNARAGHTHCSRYIRSYLSDKQTWEHFWPKDKFPGIEPRRGHTERCLQRSGKHHANAAAMKEKLTAPVPKANLDQRSLLSVVGLSNSAPAAGRLSPISPTTFSFQSPAPKVKRESAMSTSPAKGAITSSTTDRLIDHQSTAPATSRPIADPVSKLSTGPIISQSASKVGALTTNTTPATLAAQGPVFLDPDEMWKQFKSSFRVSDSERSRIEKSAKVQGQLRLVLDESSGQIITIEELIKRTQYRFALKGKFKRKAEDDEIEKDQAQKRAATFLDRLARERE